MLRLFRAALTSPFMRQSFSSQRQSSVMVELLRSQSFKDIEALLKREPSNLELQTQALRQIARNIKFKKFDPSCASSSNFKAIYREVFANLATLKSNEISALVFALRILKRSKLVFLEISESDALRLRINQLAASDELGMSAIGLFFDLTYLNTFTSELDLYILKLLEDPNKVFNLVEINQVLQAKELELKYSYPSIIRAAALRLLGMPMERCTIDELVGVLVGFAKHYNAEQHGMSSKAIKHINRTLLQRIEEFQIVDCVKALEYSSFLTGEGLLLLAKIHPIIEAEAAKANSKLDLKFYLTYFKYMSVIVNERDYNWNPEVVAPILHKFESLLGQKSLMEVSAPNCVKHLVPFKEIVRTSLLDKLFAAMSKSPHTGWDWKFKAIWAFSQFDYSPATVLVESI